MAEKKLDGSSRFFWGSSPNQNISPDPDYLSPHPLSSVQDFLTLKLNHNWDNTNAHTCLHFLWSTLRCWEAHHRQPLTPPLSTLRSWSLPICEDSWECFWDARLVFECRSQHLRSKLFSAEESLSAHKLWKGLWKVFLCFSRNGSKMDDFYRLKYWY